MKGGLDAPSDSCPDNQGYYLPSKHLSFVWNQKAESTRSPGSRLFVPSSSNNISIRSAAMNPVSRLFSRAVSWLFPPAQSFDPLLSEHERLLVDEDARPVPETDLQRWIRKQKRAPYQEFTNFKLILTNDPKLACKIHLCIDTEHVQFHFFQTGVTRAYSTAKCYSYPRFSNESFSPTFKKITAGCKIRDLTIKGFGNFVLDNRRVLFEYRGEKVTFSSLSSMMTDSLRLASENLDGFPLPDHYLRFSSALVILPPKHSSMHCEWAVKFSIHARSDFQPTASKASWYFFQKAVIYSDGIDLVLYFHQAEARELLERTIRHIKSAEFCVYGSRSQRIYFRGGDVTTKLVYRVIKEITGNKPTRFNPKKEEIIHVEVE